MQSIDPRGRQEASGTSARATDPFSKPAEPPLMLPNDPGTRNTFEALDEDASDLGFNLDSLPYSKLESHTKARLIIEDFLDIKKYEELRRQKEAIARDLNDFRNLTITRDAQKRKESIEEAIRHKEELKAARQSSRRSSRDSFPSPQPEEATQYLQTYRGYILKEEIRREEDQGNGYRQGRAQGYEQKKEQAFAGNLNDPDGSDGDPEGGNRRGSEGNGHGGRGGGHGGPTKGQGNEPLRDLGRGYGPLDGLEPNRPFTYGTLGDLDDDDDFLELGTADPHSRAKELALFARSFLKELKYSSLKNDFNTRLKIFADHACRYGLTTDDYLAAFLIMLAGEAIGFYYNYVIKAKLPTFKANAIAKESAFLDQQEQSEKQATIEYFTTECFAIASTLTTSRILRILREIATGDPTLIHLATYLV
ncbi:hypothetical protein MBM_08856 [Drepanopeziza brunnea f. sp. 'multigermtubi' MB_m1]|uniref:Uncharacterized protein n=1 Tax=Marssonina brunnea f. sp. multigermtubi (strain MB_m1) TaxID=1072389 RepID=K1XKX8_MARBU|nr:uncharacterized protein MBM_08856 [Drepanopeziza brunnea f. sp. 'multigermtubi' MB_m1]EKD13094.1 hypothetical protein MBM_08856 [Drepanopeziza brunnea f. sp. 'multigermtubi' MB_m1]